MCASCPSPTPCGLGLGPTDPGTINVAQETLDLRRARFSPTFTLLVPALALVQAPHGLSFMLPRPHNAPLPIPPYAPAPWLRLKTSTPITFRAAYFAQCGVP